MTDRPDTLAQRNEWLEGVQARAEFEGGYYRLPASDWEGVLDCFAFGERLLEQRTQERDEDRVILAAAVVRMRELEEALRQYADARHWGICRDDLRYRLVSWIGPGAEEKPVPNPVKIAREALEGDRA